MAKLPPSQKISLEDFPDQTEWIGRLIEPINTFVERLSSVLNKGISINDNMAGAILTVELNGSWPVKVAWNLSQRPLTAIVGNVYLSTGATFTLTTAVQVQWQFNQSGQLQIDGVTGITPTSSAKYKVVLECKTG